MNTSVDRTTPPARIGHYLLGEKLGQGGMGVVYSAQDELQSRPVAIKFLIAKWAKDPRAIECFHQEACIASTLKHLHLCAVYEFGDVVDGPYMVMELLSGQTLRDLLNGWPLALVRTLDIAIQVADAMEAVHGTGIIHRDITSSNIFITETGLVKVLDFGLAKLCDRTQPESAPAVATPSGPSIPSLTFGTTSYMSPEQTAGQELDQRSDIFSLGIVLYEMATGMLPFHGVDSGRIMQSILSEAYPLASKINPNLPAVLDCIITKVLQKDRGCRYQTMAALKSALQSFVA